MVAETLCALKSFPLEKLEFPVGNPKWEIHAIFLSIWILVPSSTSAKPNGEDEFSGSRSMAVAIRSSKPFITPKRNKE